MKVLQLYYKMPFPAYDGGAVSILSTTKSLLAAELDVTILAMNQVGNPTTIADIDQDFVRQTKFQIVPVNNKITSFGAFKSFVKNSCYFTSRFDSREYQKKLENILQENTFDIVELEHLFLHGHIKTIRRFSTAAIVLRSQNIEHQIWQNYLTKMTNPFVRAWLGRELRKLKKIEDSISNQLDGIICLTVEDATYFKNLNKKTPVKAIAVGIPDQPIYKNKITLQLKEIKFYHLGSMDWRPNIEGIKWFLERVIPTLTTESLSASFHFAGKNMPKHFLKMNNGKSVFIYDRVADADEFLEDKQVLVVPLFSGSGVRIKILEALRNGKPIISTTIGAQGIDPEIKKHLLIANTPEEFQSCIKDLISNYEHYQFKSETLKKLIFEKYSIEKIGLEYAEFYNSLLKVKE